MLERTIDLQAIQARIENCASYNFGMRNADQLAHVDAPDLLIALRKAEAERDGLLATIKTVRKSAQEALAECPDDEPEMSALWVFETLEASPAQSLAAARRKARWELGDSSWANVILSAYFNPEQANEDLNAEMGDD